MYMRQLEVLKPEELGDEISVVAGTKPGVIKLSL